MTKKQDNNMPKFETTNRPRQLYLLKCKNEDETQTTASQNWKQRRDTDNNIRDEKQRRDKTTSSRNVMRFGKQQAEI